MRAVGLGDRVADRRGKRRVVLVDCTQRRCQLEHEVGRIREIAADRDSPLDARCRRVDESGVGEYSQDPAVVGERERPARMGIPSEREVDVLANRRNRAGEPWIDGR